MKTIIVKSQEEFDKITEVKADEEVIIEKEDLELKCILNVYGILKLKVSVKTSLSGQYVLAWEQAHVEARGQAHVEAWGQAHVVAREQAHVEAWEQAHVEAWGQAHVEAREQAHVEAREQAHVVARGQAHVVAWEQAHVEAREQAHVEAWGQAHVEAWGQAHVVAREQAHVVAWEQAFVRVYSKITLELNGLSVAIIPFNLKFKIKKSKTALVQKVKDLGWFDNNSIKKTGKIILYKRVSKDFKTQEETKNETLWGIGTIVTHKNWNPSTNECGEGKFHAVSRPYFSDEFRNRINDKYIAIEINKKDLYEWKDNPQYPHKIGFKQGKVLYECDRYGNKI